MFCRASGNFFEQVVGHIGTLAHGGEITVLGIAIGQLTQLGDLSEQSKHGVCTGSAVRSCDEVRIRVFPRYSNHQPMHIAHGYIRWGR